MTKTKTPIETELQGGPIDEQPLYDAIDIALHEAKQLGADQAEANASAGQGLGVSVRLGEMETIEHTRDRGLVVSVYFDGKNGAASTSDYSKNAVLEAVRSACSIASLTESDPANGLPDEHRLATEFPNLDSWHPISMSVTEMTEEAVRCEDAARAVDSKIVNSEGASVSSDCGIDLLGNSFGFRGLTRRTRYSTSCAVIGQTESGMQRDYWYHATRNKQDLQSAEQIGKCAGERTVRRLDARRLATGKYPVLFEAPVASGLLSHLIQAISGGALYRKSSFLLDHAGKQIFPEFVRIHERPFMRRGMGSSAFDNEGVATVERDIVTDGVLQGYVLSSYSSRRLGLETTGNAGGVHNLTIESGSNNLDQLLGVMRTGLLVTELAGFGINMVTGDYSRGASGFWVENGEIQFPVEELTIAGNLADMFRNISAVGSDIDLRGNYQSGSILISEMTIAGE